MAFKIKRVYEPATPADGTRVLVDRLWPRGLSKSRAHLTCWMKDVAPSASLRVWFGHRPERFAEFSRRYERELSGNPAVATLRGLGTGTLVTLLYAAHDPLINHARVLQSILRSGTAGSAKRRP